MAEGWSRPAWAEIDVAAVRHNVEVLRRVVGSASFCAVVKADAYGHGAVAVAEAAIEGGADSLAVAIVDEGVELRDAGVTRPVLLLSEPPVDAAGTVVAGGLTPTLATSELIGPLAAAAGRAGIRHPVHVKVDTGMHRMGADTEHAAELVAAVAAEPSLVVEGIWTHLAVADGSSGEDREFTEGQLDRFERLVDSFRSSGTRPRYLHAANSAAAIAWPRARYDLVRCGIAVYGHLPSPSVATAFATAAAGESLRPVLALRARVSAVRRLDAGERPSYGRLRPLPGRSVVATVPVGYADGVPRALFAGGFEVLIGGRRRPLAGMVTMDQIVVDCGPDESVAPGDEVTLLGRQGDEEIDVAEWADRLGTIGYEVLCGIGPRVPRVVVGAGPDPGTGATAGRAGGTR
jgi:alanine racemase